MIRVRCPGCQQTIQFENDKAGQTVQCPSCGKGFRLPPIKSAVTGTKTGGSALVKGSQKKQDSVPIPVQEDEWSDRSPYAVKHDPGPQNREEEEQRVSELVRRAERIKARERALASVTAPGFFFKAVAFYCAVFTVIVFLVLTTDAVLAAFQRKLHREEAAQQKAKIPQEGDQVNKDVKSGEVLSWTERMIFGRKMHFVVVELCLVIITAVALGVLGVVLTGAEKFRRFDSYEWVLAGSITGIVAGLGGAALPIYFFYQLVSDSGAEVYQYIGRLLAALLTLPFPAMGILATIALVMASSPEIKREFFWRPGQPITDMDEEYEEYEEEEEEE